MQLPFSSYKLESTVSSQRIVNCYAEALPTGSKGPIVLRRAPGITTFSGFDYVGHGLHAFNGQLYAVVGPNLWRIGVDGSQTDLGSIDALDQVCMASGPEQLYTDTGYIFDGTLTEITDPDYTAGGKAAFIDNYLLALRPNTGQLFWSSLADFESYDALDFATAEGAPDKLLSVEADHRQAVLVGAASTEIWENSGNGFTRVMNGFIELGGVSKFGITKQDQSVYWIANDRTMRRLSGNTAARVSQHAFERAMRGYDVTQAQMFSYTMDGHLCVVIRFPGDGTWIYDATTQELHERQTYGRDDWDVSGIAECYGKVYVQRASDGSIGELTKEAYQEFGEPLVMSWTYQNIPGGRITLDRVEMGVETGVGLESGGDPVIDLEVSTDGGRIYRPMPSRTLGAMGHYRHRVHWDRCGSGYDIVIRGRVSDPVPVAIWSTEAAIR